MKETLSKEDAEIIEALQGAVAALGDEATADHPLVQVLDKAALAYRDKAALLKRDWTDEMFQEGEDDNDMRVAEIEAMLASGLSVSGSGLEDGGNLGSALDLVGVYMKNYKLDKANAVLDRCAPHVSKRGGVWMVKWLNHVSTVRMKQSRHLEALEMMYDLELYSPYSAEEAPAFFETLNRNLAWALKACGRIDEAAVYFERMARDAQAHKGGLDWFDCWDIGKLMATRAFKENEMTAFYRGRELMEKALQMQIDAEPHDLVMRAKVHDTLAECFLVSKEYEKAEEHYRAGYKLMADTVGRNSPLFGKQARHMANLLLAQEKRVASLPFLREALVVETCKDAVSVAEVMELVGLIVETQQKCGLDVVDTLESNHAPLKTLQGNLRGRGLDKSKEYGILCHKMSLIYLHESKRDRKALKRAYKLAKNSVRLLMFGDGGTDTNDWLQMAQLHYRMLSGHVKNER